MSRYFNAHFRSEYRMNNYCIDKKIGEGAYGQVYKGTKLKTGEKVAIKIVDLENDLDRLEFKNEVMLMKGTETCGHVVKVIDYDIIEVKRTKGVGNGKDVISIQKHDFGSSNVNGGYLITKLYYKDLFKYCKEVCGSPKENIAEPDSPKGDKSQEYNSLDYDDIVEKCPENLVLEVGYQIAQALACIHSLGFIHCDVKEENIFVELENGRRSFYLGDFGHTIKIESAGNKKIGTPVFIQPELENTPKKDVWALGVVLYEMTYGHLPYEDTYKYLRDRNFKKFDPIVFEACGYVSILKGMLELDPKNRYTAEKVVDELRKFTTI